MKKFYNSFLTRNLLLVFLLTTVFNLATEAQITAQIGTGTSIPANTLYSPVYRFSATSTTTGSRNNIVFTQAEMTAAGIPAGAVIQSIQFHKTNAANFLIPAQHSVYMANTTNTSLATTLTWASDLSTHTQVYTNNNFNLPLAAGWVTWNITPFIYTGGSLEIAMETAMTGGGTGATDKFEWEFTPGNDDKIVGVASATGATLNGGVAGYKQRPNIRITYTADQPIINYGALAATCNTTDRTLAGVTISDPDGIPTTGALMPRIYFKKSTSATWSSNAGTLASGTGTDGVWDFNITGASMGGVNLGDVIQYFVVAQDNLAHVGSIPPGITATDVNTITVYPPVPNSYNVNTLSGTYTVGAGGNYTTLSAAIDAYNNSCMNGPVVFSLTDASYTETAGITIEQHANASTTNTLTIRPATGVNASINTSVAAGAGIRILGSHVIIDGSNNGSTSRNLTINNSSTTTPQVIFIGSDGTTPVTNVTVKNSNIINGVITSSAIVIRDVATTGGYYNDLTLDNNSIQRAYFGIYVSTATAAGNGTGLNIINNDLNEAGTNNIRYGGIYVYNGMGGNISGNRIGNFETTSAEIDKGIWLDNSSNFVVKNNDIYNLNYTGTGVYAPSGIVLSQVITNATIDSNRINNLLTSGNLAANGIVINNSDISGVTIERNIIDSIRSISSAAASGAYGIGLASTSTTANTVLRNNFISEIMSAGNSSPAQNGHGIHIASGAGYSLYHNTVSLSSNQVSGSGTPSALFIGSGVTAADALDIRNNIFANLQTGGSTDRYAIYSAAPNTVFDLIDHNNYYSEGTNLAFLSGGQATLAALQTAFGGNTNSISIEPIFVATSDLHLIPLDNSAMDDMGTPIAGITTDIDGDTRSTTNPDMGADEFASVCSNPVISVHPLSQQVCLGNDINLTVTATGLSIMYQWRKDGVDIPGATSNTLAINNFTAAASGSYDVVISSGNCSVTSNAAVISQGASNSWLGVVSSDWNTAANWCGGVPTATSDISIPTGTNFAPMITSSGMVRNLVIENGATMTVTQGGRLMIYGDLDNNGTFVSSLGNIEFRGSANQSIDPFTSATITMNGSGGITLNGNVTTSDLTLTNGNITLGANNFTLTGSALGSAASHIITNGTGKVTSKNITASLVTIPVGPNAASYNPVSILNGQNRDFTVSVAVGINPAIANSARAINRTWNVQSSGTLLTPAEIILGYEDSHANPSADPSAVMEVAVHNGTTWVMTSPSGGTMPTGPATARQATSFSTLSGPMVVSSVGGINYPTGIVSPGGDVHSVQLLPNPVETVAHVRVQMNRSSGIEWTVIDLSGREILKSRNNLLQGANNIEIYMGGMITGQYILQGRTEQGKTFVIRFMKR